MAITNSERVGKALDLLKEGLRPYVERELKATYKDRWLDTARPSFPDWQQGKDGKALNWDSQAILQVMCDLWNDCFRKILGPSDRSVAFELRDVRNKWAHQKAFSTDDAYRAIDSVSRLLSAVSAEQVEAVEQMKAEILRVKFEEQLRSQKRKESSIAVEGKPATGLRPWREIVMPHPDVASGPISAGRVRSRSVAGLFARGLGRIQRSRRILSPDVHHRRFAETARQRTGTAGRQGRRPGGGVAD